MPIIERNTVIFRNDQRDLLTDLCGHLSSEGRKKLLCKYGKHEIEGNTAELEEPHPNMEGQTVKVFEGHHLQQFLYKLTPVSRVTPEYERDTLEANLPSDRFLADLSNTSKNSMALLKVESMFEILSNFFQTSKFQFLLSFFEYCYSHYLPLRIFDGSRDLLAQAISDMKAHKKAFIQLQQDGMNDTEIIEILEKRFQQSQETTSYPAEIKTIKDYRLVPYHQGNIIGRDDNIQEVLSFLNSNKTCAYVTGVAGIGKTEICRLALKKWIEAANNERILWINVDSDTNAEQLLLKIALSLGVPRKEAEQISTLADLQPILPSCLLYFDNLESVVQSPDGISLIRELPRIQGVRILGSSFISLQGILGDEIKIDRLNEENSRRFFLMIWKGEEIENDDGLISFLNNELGGHCLSIYLIASLGHKKKFDQILTDWEKTGTSSASLQYSSNTADRHTQLDKALHLVVDALKTDKDALALWQFAALFPDGIDQNTLSHWESISQSITAAPILEEYNILKRNGDIYTTLPPICRYALGFDALNSKKTEFEWENARFYAYCYFSQISFNSKSAPSTQHAVLSETVCVEQAKAIANLFEKDFSTAKPLQEAAILLHQQLEKVYEFCPVSTSCIIDITIKLFNDPLSYLHKGISELVLGNVDQAKNRINQALDGYSNQEQPHAGAAYCLSLLGEIQLYKPDPKGALEFFIRAKSIYESLEAWRGFCQSCLNIASAYEISEQFEPAFPECEQALKKAKKIGDDFTVACTLGKMASLSLYTNSLENAEKYAKQACSIFEQLKRLPAQANMLMILGDINAINERFENAEELYQSSIDLYKKSGDIKGEGNGLLALANACKLTGRITEADRRYEQAHDAYKKSSYHRGLSILNRNWKEIKNHPSLAVVHERSTNYYLRQKNFEKAYQQGRKAAYHYVKSKNLYKYSFMRQKFAIMFVLSNNPMEAYQSILISVNTYINLDPSEKRSFPLPLIVFSEVVLRYEKCETYLLALQLIFVAYRHCADKQHYVGCCIAMLNQARLQNRLGALTLSRKKEIFEAAFTVCDQLGHDKIIRDYILFSLFEVTNGDHEQYLQLLENFGVSELENITTPEDPTCINWLNFSEP